MYKDNLNSQGENKPNAEIRKDFYKRIFYIGLCIIPIVLFIDRKGSFRFLLLPFLVIGMYQLIVIVVSSRDITDDFFPLKASSEKTIRLLDKVIPGITTILFFVGLIFLIFEIEIFDNTIYGTRLFWMGGSVGIVLAIILTILLKLLRPGIYDESGSRYTVYYGLFIGLFLTTSALTGFINHHFAIPTTFCKKYVIARKSISTGRHTEYFLFIKFNNNRKERFSVDKTRYDLFEEGGEIELCMLKGKFGFDYVKDFKKPEKPALSDSNRLMEIGKMLTQLDTLTPVSRFIPHVVRVGNGLFQKMTDIHNHATSYDFQITRGDLDYPYGDNKADYVLTIISDYHDVAVRLRHNESLDKFDILGYMTLCNK
ncbi:hypothetical protein [Chitinophaga sp.]|uniref:hypothetical protein n=1 Tax=Chitinophaga sp. TaxID=1869181 RepID=UPI0031D52F6F